ncbi:transcriptional repressor [Priestia megaterium]|uniref:transcriptional repressor n=1 Tax=Priestia megaterium TaxID=1404 RepID=UPI00203D3F04|nr:transcriptional repressor [Priestia megaterium]MCM3186414.1 transcriptional repressor [Priestia megaterium]
MTKEGYIFFLRKRGYNLTLQRIILISYFYDNQNKMISTQTIINHLKKGKKNISFDTIYKNLILFADIGLLNYEKIEGRKFFHLRNKV